MRLKMLLAAAAVALTATAASAQNRLDSNNYSRGPNAVAPSRAIMNPRSSMYGFGARHRHRTYRHHRSSRHHSYYRHHRYGR